MTSRLCGKVIHLTEGSADIQADSLKDRYGVLPNTYKCDECSTETVTVWHVGYGYDASKLSKKARRHRKEASARKRKRKRNHENWNRDNGYDKDRHIEY